MTFRCEYCEKSDRFEVSIRGKYIYIDCRCCYSFHKKYELKSTYDNETLECKSCEKYKNFYVSISGENIKVSCTTCIYNKRFKAYT